METSPPLPHRCRRYRKQIAVLAGRANRHLGRELYTDTEIDAQLVECFEYSKHAVRDLKITLPPPRRAPKTPARAGSGGGVRKREVT